MPPPGPCEAEQEAHLASSLSKTLIPLHVSSSAAATMPPHPKDEEYLELLEEEEMYDHVKLGTEQELFFVHEHSPGSWFFLPYGTRVYNKLQDFIRAQYRNRGYEEVKSPNIFNMKLLETSGCAANYKENMFLLEIDKQEFGLKSMNCPSHCLMFKH